MMLKRVGFYAELGEGNLYADGSIHDAVRTEGPSDEREIVDYLRSGNGLVYLMEGTPDVITGETGFLEASGGSSYLTDGVWLWRLDLPYYVALYHVDLPDAFLNHIRACHYKMQELSREELAQLESREATEVGPDWWG